ncbi:MAG: FAD-dependent oxidoreductase [Mycobacteriales bacterium]
MVDQLVVVGGSLSGLRAAESLLAAGFPGTVTVIGEEPEQPYNRPALSKQALTQAEAYELELFRRKPSWDRIQWRLGRAVVGAAIGDGQLDLADGEQIPFDGLVVATGLRPRRLAAPGPAAGRYVLRTAGDSRALRRVLSPGARVVVVGGGFLGCEVAASASVRGSDVTLVIPQRRPLEQHLGGELADVVARRHARHGVQIRTEQAVVGLRGEDRVEGVVLGSGDVLAADVVVEAVGSKPNVDWLAGNGLDLEDGVLCDNSLRAVGGDRVVAVGDVARFPHPLYGDRPRRIEHWNMVPETAKRAAHSLVAEMGYGSAPDKPFVPIPSFWTDQYDLRLQAFGNPASGLHDTRVLHEGPDHELVVGYHLDGTLVGVAGLGAVKSLLPHRAELVARADALQAVAA